jgi:hypothetical protein
MKRLLACNLVAMAIYLVLLIVISNVPGRLLHWFVESHPAAYGWSLLGMLYASAYVGSLFGLQRQMSSRLETATFAAVPAFFCTVFALIGVYLAADMNLISIN